MNPGKVYLVGAGPGDPNLLTVEAFNLLKTADVVFHDDLVSPEVLAIVPPHVHVENVGKRCGTAKITQEQIHSLLINAAREGWMVVRLKSGDPLVFGRAGEELEALRSAGIDYAIVPGITAAVGAAARAGISLTDRRFASRLIFLSNHQCAAKSSFDRNGGLSDATLVIYMPGSDYHRIAANLCADGLAPETPCLLISQATRPQHQVHLTTLAGLPSAPRYSAPVLLLIGAVAAGYNHPTHTPEFATSSLPAFALASDRYAES
jgi:uroporphyrin-III C-methyltransferase